MQHAPVNETDQRVGHRPGRRQVGAYHRRQPAHHVVHREREALPARVHGGAYGGRVRRLRGQRRQRGFLFVEPVEERYRPERDLEPDAHLTRAGLRAPAAGARAPCIMAPPVPSRLSGT